MKKAVAVLIAFLMLLSSSMIGGSAITVERDGAQYILRSHTPTTGDINVLMVRVGFADYDVDDEEYPADSEETLLSYFDGSEDSINAFYETSSYGKLRLHCDKVYSYNAEYSRSDYDDEDFYTPYNISYLMNEALTALEDQIDFDEYDSDGDGYLDVVCFDYAGPSGAWASTWWPHVSTATEFEIGGKQIYAYSFLNGEVNVFIHEFGHIFGAADYYSTNGSSTNAIMTYDIMSVNMGDHDGFTKWSYGWINDADIVYVDKASGDMTVTLTPIESSDSGKKIAVVAPEIDPSKGFIDEYFLVEYDSGAGNNASVFEQYALEPGFRIFHVNAECTFIDGEPYIYYTKDNVALRDNLIHNVKNELDDPYMWGRSDMYFHEGDSLTPESYPNTGLSIDGIYNGRYTGISFTDFVTGNEPSFKVSFSDDPAPEMQINLTLDYEELKSDAEMEVSADTYITRRLMMSLQDEETYSPYLLDGNGEKLTLTVNSTNDPYTYRMNYQNSYPSVEPNTEYTLVIPEGCFKAGYNQDVPEFRQKVVTADFLALTVISSMPVTQMNSIQSNLFAVTDNTYGVVRIPINDQNGRFTFTEYNLNGEEISSLSFDAPDYDREDNHLYRVSVKKLNDGNFALIMNTFNGNYFVKIDRQGKILSNVYSVSDQSVSDYVYYVADIDFDLYKGGLCKMLTNDDWESAMLIIDFESEPSLTQTDPNHYYYSLDSETYVEERFYDRQNHVLIFNKADEQTADIGFDAGFLCAFEENGNVTVLKDRYDRDLEESFLYADTYSKDGELIESRDITENAEYINYYGVFNRCIPSKDGYFLESDDQDYKMVIAYDKDWNWLGSFNIDLVTTNYACVGNCGLTGKAQYDAIEGTTEIISRFHIGDFEIVPAPTVSKLGDANLDGEVDITDATTIQRYDAKMLELSDIALKLADVDGDGEVTIIDATFIQRFLVNLPAPEGIGEPIDTEPAQPSEIEHKLLSCVDTYQWDYEYDDWELSMTTTVKYENGYPVLFDLLENYDDAEHVQTSIAYTFDGDQPLTRTEVKEADNSKTTVDYSDGRVYNVNQEIVSSGSYAKQMYQYGHGDEYFTVVLHDTCRTGNKITPTYTWKRSTLFRSRRKTACSKARQIRVCTRTGASGKRRNGYGLEAPIPPIMTPTVSLVC